MGELSGTIYAEFRYVYRIFLSCRVSKLQSNWNALNSTLPARETDRNLPLKCRGVWLSPVIDFRYSHRQCPAIVCQYTWGPLALVPLSLSQNSLRKSFTVFVTDFAEIFWEKIQVWLQKVDFQAHIASHSFVRSQQVLHNILIVRCLWFPKKSLQILLKDNHAFLSVSFRSSSNCLSCISSVIWGPVNVPSLFLRHLYFGTYSSHIWIHGRFYPCLSQGFVMRPSFMCKGGR